MTASPSLTQEELIEQNRAAARAYIDAVNAKDLEAILALFAEDAVVHDPVGLRRFAGKAALREFYTGVITRARLEVIGPIRGSYTNAVAASVRAHVPGVSIDVITVTQFNEKGLIKDYAAYWGPTDKSTTA